MSTEQNKAVVRRFIEQVLNTGDTALVDEILDNVHNSDRG
jgi:hypothetical protein